MKFIRAAVTVIAAAATTVGGLTLAPAAGAQTIDVPGSGQVFLPDVPALPGVPAVPGVPALPDLSGIPGEVTDAVTGSVDQLLPGVLPAPAPAPAVPLPAPTGCSAIARACINLSDQTAWLQDGGRITRGPVPISSGRPGYATPTGLTRVTRKVIDEWSRPYNGPMPYSVYFSAGTSYPSDIGIAFHEGDPAVPSHGCIHLRHDDAVAFFTTLNVGDHVDVVA